MKRKVLSVIGIILFISIGSFVFAETNTPTVSIMQSVDVDLVKGDIGAFDLSLSNVSELHSMEFELSYSENLELSNNGQYWGIQLFSRPKYPIATNYFTDTTVLSVLKRDADANKITVAATGLNGKSFSLDGVSTLLFELVGTGEASITFDILSINGEVLEFSEVMINTSEIIETKAPTITFSPVSDLTNQDVIIDASLATSEGTIESRINSVTLFKDSILVDGYNLGDSITESGHYQLTVEASSVYNGVTYQSSKAVDFIIDKISPVIDLSEDIPESIEAGTSYTLPEVIISDNVDTDFNEGLEIEFKSLNSDDYSIVDFFDITKVGTYRLTYSATDTLGNSTQRIETISLVDTVPPGEPKIIINPETQTSEAVTVNFTGNSEDDYLYKIGEQEEFVLYNGPFDVTDNANISVKAVDLSGNESSVVTKLITNIDKEAPVIVFDEIIPAAMEVNSSFIVPEPIVNDNYNSDLSATYTIEYKGKTDDSFITVDSIDETVLGTYRLTFNAVDEVGNSSQVVKSFSYVDTTAPALVLVGEGLINQEVNMPYEDLGVDVVDNYDTDISVEKSIIYTDLEGIESSVDVVDTTVLGTYTISYSSVDTNGNVSDVITRIINIVDTTAPVVTLIGESEADHEVKTPFSDQGIDVTDNYDAELNVDRVITYIDLEGLETTVAAVDTNMLGTYILEYSVTDASGNTSDVITRKIMIEDTTAPVVTLVGSSDMTHEVKTPFTDEGVQVSDNFDTELVVDQVITFKDLEGKTSTVETIDVDVLGIYTLKYSVTDTSGNTSDVISRKLTIKDTTAPVVTLVGNSEITHEVKTPYADEGVQVTDNFDTEFTVDQVITYTDLEGASSTVDGINVSLLGTYTLNYSVTDLSGNTSEIVTRTMTVEDTTAPVITIAGENFVQLEYKKDIYAEGTIEVTDNFDTQVSLAKTITFIDENYNSMVVDTIDSNQLGSYKIDFSAIDSSGNTAVKKTKGVYVVDQTPPAEPTFTIDPTTPTNLDATITLSSESEIYYKTDYEAEFIKYTSPFTISDNLPVIAYAVDQSGNRSNTINELISNIDKIKPEFNLSLNDAVQLGNGEVITDTSIAYDVMTTELNKSIHWTLLDASNTKVASGTNDIAISNLEADNESFTLEVMMTDEAGNETVKTKSFIVDNTAPSSVEINESHYSVNKALKMISLNNESNQITNDTLVLRRSGEALELPTDNATIYEGLNSFNIFVKDEAGNASAITTFDVTLDTTKPLIQLNKTDNNDGTYTIDIASNEEISNVTLKLNDEATTNVTNNTAEITLAAGDNRIVVTGEDKAGNVGKGIIFETVISEAGVTEDIQVTDGLTIKKDTGDGLSSNLQINSVDVTPENSKTFVNEPIDFTGEVTGDTVYLDFNIGLGKPENTKLYYKTNEGNWVTLDQHPEHGDSYYNDTSETQMIDLEGKEIQVQPGYLVAALKHFSTYGAMADTQAPKLTIDTNSGFMTDELILSGAVDESAELTVGSETFNVEGNFTLPLSLNEGPVSLVIYATDASGNESSHIDLTGEIDKTAPVITISNKETKASNETINYVIAEENLDSIKMYKANTLINVTTVKDSNFNVSLDEGSNMVKITATDEAGNTTEETIMVTLDTTAPVITVNEGGNVITADAIKRSQDITLDISASDGTLAVEKDGSVINGFDGTIALAKGDGSVKSYELTIKATDNLGNSAYKNLTVTIDDEVPEISLDNIVSGQKYNVPLTPSITVDQGDLYLDYVVQTEKDSNYVSVSIENNTEISNDGIYKINATAVKSVGSEVKTVNETYEFVIDQVKPTVIIQNVADGQTYTEAVTPIVTGDDILDASVTVTSKLNGQNYDGNSINQNGMHTLIVLVEDWAGNITEETINFEIAIDNSNNNSNDNSSNDSSSSGSNNNSSNGSPGIPNTNSESDDEEDTLEIVKASEITVNNPSIVIDELPIPKENNGLVTKNHFVTKIYDLSSENDMTEPVNIEFKLDKEIMEAPEKLGIFKFNAFNNRWQFIGGKVDESQSSIAVKSMDQTQYAVMSVEKTFDDVKEHWAKKDIELMASRLVVNGSNGEFKPNDNITRGEFIAMLVRTIDLDTSVVESYFIDLKETDWYTPVISVAYQNDIVNGVSENEFAPMNQIKREEMAVMIMNAFKLMNPEEYEALMTQGKESFKDSEDISSWAKNEVKGAFNKGIINGRTVELFVPKANATRAEAAVMIKRLQEILLSEVK